MATKSPVVSTVVIDIKQSDSLRLAAALVSDLECDYDLEDSSLAFKEMNVSRKQFVSEFSLSPEFQKFLQKAVGEFGKYFLEEPYECREMDFDPRNHAALRKLDAQLEKASNKNSQTYQEKEDAKTIKGLESRGYVVTKKTK